MLAAGNRLPPLLRPERSPEGQAAPLQRPAGAAPASKRLLVFLLLLVLVGAGCYRLFLLNRYYLIPDADQTVLGLMARHILAGERPVFYWGQPYTGAGEAYLTAILFALFGQHDILLHLVPFAASLLFTAAVCVLGWRLYGLAVAALSGIYLSLAPILLIEWGFWAGSGYLEMMACGSLALLLALPPRPGEAATAWRRLPLCFLLLGLAVWIQPTAVLYGLAVVALLFGRIIAVARAPRRWAGGLALTACCLALLAAGMAPMLIYNLQHNGETLQFLLQRGEGSALNPLTILSRAVLWAAPVLVGLVPPTTSRPYLYGFVLAHLALYGAALGLSLLIITLALARWRAVLDRCRSVFSPQPRPDLGLLVLVSLVLIGFLTSSWGATQWSETQPRYLLPLYTATPLVLRLVLPRRISAAAWTAALLLVGAVAAGNVYVNSTTFSRTDVRPLARLLAAHGITAVYGDYWTVYPLIYASKERIAGVAVNDDLSRGYNRRLSYLRAAAASTHYAWVAATGSARQRSILACLHALHSTYHVLVWRDQTIYDAPSGAAFPYWNGGRCAVVALPPSAS